MEEKLRFFIKEDKKRKRLTLKKIDNNISEEKINSFTEAYQTIYKNRQIKKFKFVNDDGKNK